MLGKESVMLVTAGCIEEAGYTAQAQQEFQVGRATQDQAERWKRKYQGFKQRIRNLDIVLDFGSARNHVPSLNSIVFDLCLSELLVANGIARGNGWGDCGFMLMASYAQIGAWKGDFEKAKRAPLVGVPLLFQGQSTEGKFRPSEHFPEIAWLRNDEMRKQAIICSPAHCSLRTRTPCLFTHERVRAQIYKPGGSGTFEELATGGADAHLAKSITSVFNHAVYPTKRFFFDDCVMYNGRRIWFWDGMIQQLENMAIFGTAEKSSMSDIVAIRIGKGDNLNYPESGITARCFNTPSVAAEFVMSEILNAKPLN